MKEWLKSMLLLVVGNSLCNVAPVWLTQYLLTLPNPFYSVGQVLVALPTISLSGISPDFEAIKQFAGVGIIGYAVYLIAKMINKK